LRHRRRSSRRRYIMPVLKFPSQLFLPIQAGAGNYKQEHVQVTSVTSLEFV